MEKFINKKYKLERCENLDELLKEMEVNTFLRKVASSMSSIVQLIKNEDEYTLNIKMLLLTISQKFKLGEETEVTTTDGRRVKNVFTIDGNILTEKQIGEKTLTIVREFFDDEMIATSYYGNVVCKVHLFEVVELALNVMDKFLNKKYKLIRFDDYYEDYLEAIGLNIFNRKIAKSMPSLTQLIKLSEVEYAINTIIPLITHQQKFVLGQEIKASTIDGRNIKNIFSIEGNKLIELQIEPKREVTVVREYFDEEMEGECIVGDIRCKYWCEVKE